MDFDWRPFNFEFFFREYLGLCRYLRAYIAECICPYYVDMLHKFSAIRREFHTFSNFWQTCIFWHILHFFSAPATFKTSVFDTHNRHHHINMLCHINRRNTAFNFINRTIFVNFFLLIFESGSNGFLLFKLNIIMLLILYIYSRTSYKHYGTAFHVIYKNKQNTNIRINIIFVLSYYDFVFSTE